MSTCGYIGRGACRGVGVPEWGLMKTVAIISQKGGAGKTTLAVHLGAAAAEAGHTSAIIDLDPQATAAGWGDRRQVSEPEVVSGQAVRLPGEKTTRHSSCSTPLRTPTKRLRWRLAAPISC